MQPRHSDPQAESKATRPPHPQRIPPLGCVPPLTAGSSQTLGSLHSWGLAAPQTQGPPTRAAVQLCSPTSSGVSGWGRQSPRPREALYPHLQEEGEGEGIWGTLMGKAWEAQL